MFRTVAQQGLDSTEHKPKFENCSCRGQGEPGGGTVQGTLSTNEMCGPGGRRDAAGR